LYIEEHIIAMMGKHSKRLILNTLCSNKIKTSRKL